MTGAASETEAKYTIASISQYIGQMNVTSIPEKQMIPIYPRKNIVDFVIPG